MAALEVSTIAPDGQPFRVRLDWSPLAARRRAAYMTQAQLARAVGVCPATIYRIERNRTEPTASMAASIARAMGVPWYELARVVKTAER